MNKGAWMMMRNKVEELTPLDPILIMFQICEIKEGQSGFDNTSDVEADLGEFPNSRGRQRGGRQWQPNYRREVIYKLKVDIPNFSGDLNIEGFLDWLIELDKFFDYIELPKDKKVKFVAYMLKRGASIWWGRLREMRMREGSGSVQT